MAQLSLAVLKKNVSNCVVGITAMFAQSKSAFATWQKFKDRQWKYAPVEVREVKEYWEEEYWTCNLCQHNNLWVDKELHTEVTQKELAGLIRAKMDGWKAGHWLFAFFCTGGWWLPLSAYWWGNDTYMPRTFSKTKEELASWYETQDLQRYKHVPAYMAEMRFFTEFHGKLRDRAGEALDNLNEKNDVRKDPELLNEFAKYYDEKLTFIRARRKPMRAVCRAMVIPTFPICRRINLQSRIKDFWELTWNEDYMVIKDKLHLKMSDEELHEYAWRRMLAPYDKNLTRDQITERVEDYFKFLGPEFMEKGRTPNIWVTTAYIFSHYNDPAFLDMDISELDKNDFEHIAHWPKDAFLKRLEFENGPLRDEVEAYSFKKLEDRRKLLEEK